MHRAKPCALRRMPSGSEPARSDVAVQSPVHEAAVCAAVRPKAYCILTGMPSSRVFPRGLCARCPARPSGPLCHPKAARIARRRPGGAAPVCFMTIVSACSTMRPIHPRQGGHDPSSSHRIFTFDKASRGGWGFDVITRLPRDSRGRFKRRRSLHLRPLARSLCFVRHVRRVPSFVSGRSLRVGPSHRRSPRLPCLDPPEGASNQASARHALLGRS